MAKKVKSPITYLNEIKSLFSTIARENPTVEGYLGLSWQPSDAEIRKETGYPVRTIEPFSISELESHDPYLAQLATIIASKNATESIKKQAAKDRLFYLSSKEYLYSVDEQDDDVDNTHRIHPSLFWGQDPATDIPELMKAIGEGVKKNQIYMNDPSLAKDESILRFDQSSLPMHNEKGKFDKKAVIDEQSPNFNFFDQNRQRKNEIIAEYWNSPENKKEFQHVRQLHEKADNEKLPLTGDGSIDFGKVVDGVLNGVYGIGEERAKKLAAIEKKYGLEEGTIQARVDRRVKEIEEAGGKIDKTTGKVILPKSESSFLDDEEMASSFEVVDDGFDKIINDTKEKLEGLNSRQKIKYAEAIPLFLKDARDTGILGVSFEEATGMKKPIKPKLEDYVDKEGYDEAMEGYKSSSEDIKFSKPKEVISEQYEKDLANWKAAKAANKIPLPTDFDDQEKYKEAMKAYKEKNKSLAVSKPDKKDYNGTFDEDMEKWKEDEKSNKRPLPHEFNKLDEYNKDMAKYREEMAAYKENERKFYRGEYAPPKPKEPRFKETLQQPERKYFQDDESFEEANNAYQDQQKQIANYERDLEDWKEKTKKIQAAGELTGKRYSKLLLNTIGTALQNWGLARQGKDTKESLWQKDRSEFYKSGQDRMNAQLEADRASLQDVLETTKKQKLEAVGKSADTFVDAWKNRKANQYQIALYIQANKEIQKAVEKGDWSVIQNNAPYLRAFENFVGKKVNEDYWKNKGYEMDKKSLESQLKKNKEEIDAMKIDNRYRDAEHVAKMANDAIHAAAAMVDAAKRDSLF